MNEKSKLMMGGNAKLYPVSWKVAYSEGQDRFIIEAKQQKRTKLPDATVQLVLMKDHFKELAKHLSKKLKLYEEREGEIKPRVYKNEEALNAMTVWKPDEIYWE